MPRKVKAAVGIHGRLTQLTHELMDVDLGHDFDGQFVLSYADRLHARAKAQKIIDAVNELDRLDPLPKMAPSGRGG